VARRAVRYHRPYLPTGGTALDAGCGEGQDLAFLAEQGYTATGVEFTAAGARKAARFVRSRGVTAAVREQDLRDWTPEQPFDLVLAVNCVQFLGADAPAVLAKVMSAVAPGGVLGLSLFARRPDEAEVQGTVWFTTLAEVLERFSGWQPVEAAQLWQWNVRSGQAQEFVTLIARNVPPSSGIVTLG
jgi:cyclopropane fatty-acyl-phospholipid synthase-like methyltransferase